ncbi:hypothetical protein [Marinobacter sp. X15-166B]|uniref:hypothetical protein n=1 Tax=Marinobacter sp. X15-166B TaxID=1897620 RepID=UPI00094449E9|nr:hypothetical protein [Marinobacter sp. X15-166B]
MDSPSFPSPELENCVRLDQHESVRVHVYQRISAEVARLEARIADLERTPAPHAPIMIATYQRMIDRKKGLIQSWGLQRSI